MGDDDFEFSSTLEQVAKSAKVAPSRSLNENSRKLVARAKYRKTDSSLQLALALSASLAEPVSSREACESLESELKDITRQMAKLKRRRDIVIKELSERRRNFPSDLLPPDAPPPTVASAVALLFPSSAPVDESRHEFAGPPLCSLSPTCSPPLPRKQEESLHVPRKHQESLHVPVSSAWACTNEDIIPKSELESTSANKEMLGGKLRSLATTLECDDLSQSNFRCLEIFPSSLSCPTHDLSSESQLSSNHLEGNASGSSCGTLTEGSFPCDETSLPQDGALTQLVGAMNEIDDEIDTIDDSWSRVIASAPSCIADFFPRWQENVEYCRKQSSLPRIEGALAEIRLRLNTGVGIEAEALGFFIRILEVAALTAQNEDNEVNIDAADVDCGFVSEVTSLNSRCHTREPCEMESLVDLSDEVLHGPVLEDNAIPPVTCPSKPLVNLVNILKDENEEECFSSGVKSQNDVDEYVDGSEGVERQSIVDVENSDNDSVFDLTQDGRFCDAFVYTQISDAVDFAIDCSADQVFNVYEEDEEMFEFLSPSHEPASDDVIEEAFVASLSQTDDAIVHQNDHRLSSVWLSNARPINPRIERSNTDIKIVTSQVCEFIMAHRSIYEKVLTFEPIDLQDLQNKLFEEGGLRCSKHVLRDILDCRGVVVSEAHQQNRRMTRDALREGIATIARARRFGKGKGVGHRGGKGKGGGGRGRGERLANSAS